MSKLLFIFLPLLFSACVDNKFTSQTDTVEYRVECYSCSIEIEDPTYNRNNVLEHNKYKRIPVIQTIWVYKFEPGSMTHGFIKIQKGAAVNSSPFHIEININGGPKNDGYGKQLSGIIPGLSDNPSSSDAFELEVNLKSL